MIKPIELQIIFLRISVCAIAIILFVPALSFSQAPGIEWQKCLGGSKSEDPDSRLQTIVQTSDGGYVIAGRTGSNDGDVSGNHLWHGLLNADIWVVKLTAEHTIKWQKCFGGTGAEDVECIIQTSDKGYAIAGYTGSKNDGDVSGFRDGGDIDAWIIKLDSSGKLQWQKCIGGGKLGNFGSQTTAYSIIQTFDGGYAVAGETNSIDSDFFGKNHGRYDAWAAKLDAAGNIKWLDCYGGSSGSEAFKSIIQNSDGSYTLAGYTDSQEEGFSNHGGKSNSLDAYIIRIDSLGAIMQTSDNKQWQKLLGGTNDEIANCIIHTFDGGYIFTGSTSSHDGDVSGNHGSLDVWVVKLDSDGKIVWQKCLGGSSTDAALSIIQTSDSGYAIAGYTLSIDGDVSGGHSILPDSADAWVVKLNPLGVIQWQKCLGGSGIDEGFAIIQTKDGGYAVIGRTSSNNGDVSGNHGDFDIWVVKLGTKAAVESSSIGRSNFTWVYPNPSSDQIHFDLYPTIFLKNAEFYDIMGRQQFPSFIAGEHSASVDVHNLLPGTYIARLTWIQHLTWLTNDYQGSFALPFVVQH